MATYQDDGFSDRIRWLVNRLVWGQPVNLKSENTYEVAAAKCFVRWKLEEKLDQEAANRE